MSFGMVRNCVNMKRHRKPSNSLCVAVIILVIVIVLVVFNRSPLYPEQADIATESWNQHSYATKSISSTKLYYLDKYGYRIAVQSEASEYSSKTLASRPRPTAAEATLNGYDVMHGENEAERDETIDYNLNPLETTRNKGEDALLSRTNCDYGRPIQKVALLKTHRTGSSTLANILYRYGDLNDLEFALPKRSSYEYYWPIHFNPSFVDKQYMNTSISPHLLVNARLRLNSMATWKREGTFLVTVVRDVISHFESSFYSNHLDYLFKLENTSNPLSSFLKSPVQYFQDYLKNEKIIETKINFAVSGQMFDLGLKRTHLSDKTEINKIVEELDEMMDLVLISEYMDESLILLKRTLCWDIDDVLYFSHKKRHKDYKDMEVTSEMSNQIQQWNQADSILYDHFNRTLWERISEQDDNFYSELKELRQKRASLEKECIASFSIESNTGEILFNIKQNVTSFNKYLCDKMNTNERDYIAYLKKKARVKYTEVDRFIKRQFQGLEEKSLNLSWLQEK